MQPPVLVVFIAVVSIVVGIGLGSRNRTTVPSPTVAQTVEEVARTLDVHVSGWVRSPGVVVLSDGAIVADAVEAAGGFRPGASTTSVNLAAPVQGGEQIYVAGPDSAEGDLVTSGDARVAVNRASASDLESLPGVGPVLAERIVAYRDEHGAFQTVEDLLDVPGIGESKLASIRDLVRIP